MSKVHLLPIVAFFICLITFFSTSIAAIWQGHATIPYISDGAAHAPESCVFGQFVNIGAVLFGIIIYIRYRQIEELMYDYTDLIKSTTQMNQMALWFGYFSCFGLSMVANFQIAQVPSIHYVGAFTSFGTGCVYLWLQGHITYHVRVYTGSKYMAYLRLCLASLCTYFFFVVIVTHCDSVKMLSNDDQPCKYRSFSVFSEWIIATILCFYILSFSSEFRSISLNHPKIIINKTENSSLIESSQATESVSLSIDIASTISTITGGCQFIETHLQLNNSSLNKSDYF